MGEFVDFQGILTGLESSPNSCQFRRTRVRVSLYSKLSRGNGNDVAFAKSTCFLSCHATDDSLRFGDISLCRHSGQTIMGMIRPLPSVPTLRFDGSALGFTPKSYLNKIWSYHGIVLYKNCDLDVLPLARKFVNSDTN